MSLQIVPDQKEARRTRTRTRNECLEGGNGKKNAKEDNQKIR
jgi:hypothetical protein